MDSDMRRAQVTITGKLPDRQITLYVCGGKSKCVTCESNVAGIGQFKANEFLMEYEEINELLRKETQG